MNSSLIGKIEKAKRYANEKDRVKFLKLAVELRGENSTHEVSYESDKWQCNCFFFSGHRLCSHTMAMERILEGMIPTKEPVHAQ